MLWVYSTRTNMLDHSIPYRNGINNWRRKKSVEEILTDESCYKDLRGIGALCGRLSQGHSLELDWLRPIAQEVCGVLGTESIDGGWDQAPSSSDSL